MESNWRRGYWTAGLSDLFRGKAARALRPGEVYVTDGQPRASAFADLVAVNEITTAGPLYGQLIAVIFPEAKPAGNGSPFPYGFGVAPDHV